MQFIFLLTLLVLGRSVLPVFVPKVFLSALAGDDYLRLALTLNRADPTA